MTYRLLLTATVLVLAFSLFTFGVIAFIALDADDHERDAFAIQQEIRRESNARRMQDAMLFYGDLSIMHERRLAKLEKKDSLVTDSGGAAAWTDTRERVRRGPGWRRMKEAAIYRAEPTEVNAPSAPEWDTAIPTRTPESVASESNGLLESLREIKRRQELDAEEFESSVRSAVRVTATATKAKDTEPCRVKTCVPPPTWRSVRSIPPLDAPLRFGSADGPMWTWLKAGESATPCTTAEEARLRRISAEHANSYRRACDAKVGDALLTNLQFQLPRAPRTSVQSASVTFGLRPEYTAYVVTGHPRTCYGVLLSPTRCWGVWHSTPSSTFIAVWMPRIENVNRVIVVYGGVPPSPIAGWYEADVRHNDDWIILPVRSSHFAPFRGWPNPREIIEIKAVDYGSRHVGTMWEPGVGEVLLSRVDVHLLPSMQWGGVWP